MVRPRIAQHVVDREAVFRQCTPPEFSATLPPMRAGDLRRRVGRVVQAMRAPPPRRWPGCAPRAARRAVRARGSSDRMLFKRASDSTTPAAMRHRAARQARCPRRAPPRARPDDDTGLQDRLDLVFGVGNRDHHRQLTERRQRHRTRRDGCPRRDTARFLRAGSCAGHRRPQPGAPEAGRRRRRNSGVRWGRSSRVRSIVQFASRLIGTSGRNTLHEWY
jgi:hypothetical protein